MPKPVRPWLSLAATSASKSRRSLHAASFPSRAALKSGWAPLLSLTTTLAPFSNSANNDSRAFCASSRGLFLRDGSMKRRSEVALSPDGVGCSNVRLITLKQRNLVILCVNQFYIHFSLFHTKTNVWYWTNIFILSSQKLYSINLIKLYRINPNTSKIKII